MANDDSIIPIGVSQDTSSVFVYVIQQGNTDYLKIGIADNPEHRLNSLQTGNPHKLYIRCLLKRPNRDAAFELETLLHQHFSDCRVHGEWFEVSLKKVLATLELARALSEHVIDIQIFELPPELSLPHLHVRGPNPHNRVRDYLITHPDAASISVRELAAAVGVGKSTAATALAEYRTNSDSQGTP